MISIKLPNLLKKINFSKFNHRTFVLSNQVFNQSDQTHFGYENVTSEKKAEKVKNVFSSVAPNYDLMNDIMSLGVHRYWKEEFVKQLDPIPGSKIIDVAGGTGDITFKIIDSLLEKSSNQNKVDCEITVLDYNPEMLKMGKLKSEKLNYNMKADIKWIEGNAQCLPFENNYFDAYTIAFGIRNVVDINKTLQESFRVLKSGGIFMCLEFSKINSILEKPYDWYSFNIIPVLGELFAKDWKSYQYLVESIRKFPDQNDFKLMIEECGYKFVNYTNLSLGIACIHVGYKP